MLHKIGLNCGRHFLREKHSDEQYEVIVMVVITSAKLFKINRLSNSVPGAMLTFAKTPQIYNNS